MQLHSTPQIIDMVYTPLYAVAIRPKLCMTCVTLFVTLCVLLSLCVLHFVSHCHSISLCVTHPVLQDNRHTSHHCFWLAVVWVRMCLGLQVIYKTRSFDLRWAVLKLHWRKPRTEFTLATTLIIWSDQ